MGAETEDVGCLVGARVVGGIPWWCVQSVDRRRCPWHHRHQFSV